MQAPDELKLSADKRLLTVVFAAATYELPAELLRVESPSAEVRGHGPGEKRLVSGKQDVTITGIAPQGNYAVRLQFSDGHNTGIYSWDFLRELGDSQQKIWQSYLTNLLEQNLSRKAS